MKDATAIEFPSVRGVKTITLDQKEIERVGRRLLQIRAYCPGGLEVGRRLCALSRRAVSDRIIPWSEAYMRVVIRQVKERARPDHRRHAVRVQGEEPYSGDAVQMHISPYVKFMKIAQPGQRGHEDWPRVPDGEWRQADPGLAVKSIYGQSPWDESPELLGRYLPVHK